MIKKLIVIFGVLVFLMIGSYSYIRIKLDSTKEAVEDYLVNEKGINKKDIEVSKPVYDWIKVKGEKKWFVCIEIHGEEGTYYYYKDHKNNKIKLDYFVLHGVEYSSKEYKKLKGRKP
ncbi:hypothetical protein RAH41_12250 [Gottfriedia acidiceleris]|uniref:hypothetical protein n=1 Tax=Gottfriedia acidiceleris TaxID=371036 RepID=UPI002F26C1DF